MDRKILDAHTALELITDVYESAINESKMDKLTCEGLAMAAANIRLALEEAQAIIDHQLWIEHDQKIQDDIRKCSQMLYPQLRR